MFWISVVKARTLKLKKSEGLGNEKSVNRMIYKLNMRNISQIRRTMSIEAIQVDQTSKRAKRDECSLERVFQSKRIRCSLRRDCEHKRGNDLG